MPKAAKPLFRDYEHEIARRVCTLGPSVVSTGGGMLTFDRNGEILAKNGMIFYIDRPFEDCYAQSCTASGSGRCLRIIQKKNVQRFVPHFAVIFTANMRSLILKNTGTAGEAAEKSAIC